MSLRSIEKNMIGLRHVFVVGNRPKFLSDKIIYIKADDIFPRDLENKDRNQWYKISKAVEDPRLSEDFLFGSDDFLLMKESTWDDFKPRHTGLASKRYMDSLNSPNLNLWTKTRIKTLSRFPSDRRYLWHPHIFTQINKTKFLKCAKDCDFMHRNDVIFHSYYFNHYPMPKLIKDYDSKEYHTAQEFIIKERHVSHWDEAFNYTPFKKKVFSIFPEKSRFETCDIDDDMMKCYDASVIIPCYNSEKYLKECIESVLM